MLQPAENRIFLLVASGRGMSVAFKKLFENNIARRFHSFGFQGMRLTETVTVLKAGWWIIPWIAHRKTIETMGGASLVIPGKRNREMTFVFEKFYAQLRRLNRQ